MIENLLPWLHPDQEMIVGDLSDQYALEEAIKGCDAVYFAAIADLDDAEQACETARITVLGNVQEVCQTGFSATFMPVRSMSTVDGGLSPASRQQSSM